MAETTASVPSHIPALALPDGSTASESEWTKVVWKRARSIMLIGLFASLLFTIISLIWGPEAVAFHQLAVPYHFVAPLLWAVSLFILHRLSDTPSRVPGLVIAVITVVLAQMTIGDGIFFPQHDKLAGVAVVLIITAAFVPCRVGQVWLAGAALVFAILGLFVAPLVIADVGAYWSGMGMHGSLWERGIQVVGVTVIGIISIIVSRTLHSLQRTARRAKRLGNYYIERALGEGGMGKVYVARHALICRPTALKVLEPKDDIHASIARFEREVQLSASLTHPNTITIFDFGRTAQGTFYYAMEYLDGMDLQSMVETFGPLPPRRVVSLMRQALGSLAEAHERDIVHRDVKPSNIFVTHRGGLYDFVKVLDFGLARELKREDDSGLTQAGALFGTPRYIAPEAVYGASKADARSDLYNLGGVMYWMLTGTPLFGNSSNLDLIIDHVKTVPAPPSEVAEQPIPAELDAIIMRCLAKDPADRFQTAEELAEALKAIPVERWTQAEAEAWWGAHAPERLPETDCGCAPIDDETMAAAPALEPAFSAG